MAEIAGLGEMIEPGVTGIGLENDGEGVERVGGPVVGDLLDSDMSFLVSIAAALRRTTETCVSRLCQKSKRV